MLPEDAALRDAAASAAAAASSLEDLRHLRARFTGKKGEVTALLKMLRGLDADARRERGRQLNELREAIDAVFDAREADLAAGERRLLLESQRADVTLPGRAAPAGGLHPIEQTTRIVLDAMGQLGFQVAEGPEVEETALNFDALNFPPDHPAREMQDTFFLAPPWKDARGEALILRTHTSPVQIRAMRAGQAPLRIACPGRVYRCDADVTHSPMFHQIEGLWIDDRVTFRDLMGVLGALLRAVFGEGLPVRFRPSFFPFTEPSAEVDMGCVQCGGRGCRVCKGTGWLEVLGAGMVHPNVLKAGGIDPERWQGFAFGLGIERIAMLRYGVPDIRLFYESDLRFLRQLREPVLR